MFNKVLIANRGEIACRVMRTLQNLGVASVAVYSDADAQAAHVQMADQAVHIGGSAPADSYLRGDRIIQAALDTGAQAIHPGYGFLSENPDFVDAVTAAGLVFVGPSADAIRAMGLKDAAKAIMEQAGVPVVPGYHGADQSDDVLAQAAEQIGYPVLIKAVAGGGGKGMRLVDHADHFADALASARSEAKTAFGNSDVLVEKYITSPRHIEVQVFGDGVDAVHLFERDCSLQRRHQKVIEEAPAPDMPDDVRQAMCDAAVRAAKAIGYKGAGTIEFIVDGSKGLRADGFWFMEMNTRLQVEHPVTELITGIDLVDWQLRVAAGGTIPCTQDDIRISGHAFEARLYAEDVPAGFLPATGKLEHLQFSPRARNDSAVRAGDEISPFYDPMIAKVITHGPDRTTALAKLRQALDETVVTGTVTNIAFLGALARHDGFSVGQVDTGLIARDLDKLTAPQPDQTSAIIAAALATIPPSDSGAAMGYAHWGPIWHDVHIESSAGDVHTVRIACNPDGFDVNYTGTLSRVTKQGARLMCDDRPLPNVIAGQSSVTVMNADRSVFYPVDLLARGTSQNTDDAQIIAPMPGAIREVLVAAGQAVTAGATLVVLEAMKMEHRLSASRDSVIDQIFCATGDQVAAGDVLLSLQPNPESN